MTRARRLLLGLLTVAGVVGAGPAAGVAAAEATTCPPGAELSWARVQLFKDAGCGGGQMAVKADDPAPDRPDFNAFVNWDGKSHGVDNSRSSLLIAAGTCVRLYDLPNFGGDASTNICATSGRLAWNLARFDDRASSMKVCTTAAPDACGPGPATAPAPCPAPVAPAPAPGAPPAAVAPGAHYVALGDSYSSGVGTRDYRWNAPCMRGPKAYPALVDLAFGTVMSFRACGGAKTGDVLSGQVSSLKRTTKLVTISIGGNDAGFSSVIKQCAKPWPTTCWGDIRGADEFIRTELPGKLRTVYGEIRRRSPQAMVVVVGYPRLFAEADECNFAGRVSKGEQERLNDVGDQLSTVLSRAVAGRANFRFADPRAAFAGHAVCSGAEWLNGVSNPIEESFHPNVDGNRAMAEVVLATIRR